MGERQTYPEQIAQALLTMDAGLRTLGMNPVTLREAANLIRKQAEAIKRYRSEDDYDAGYRDGWGAATLRKQPANAAMMPAQKEAGDE